jgi:RNA polymerase sigma-70 factor (ECF subfamily)
VAASQETPFLQDEDRELIERCLAGREEAFDELVVRFQNMVFNLAWRFMGETQEAEDLTQEVFLKVFRSLRGFRGASSLKTWIYRITTNLALNRLKFNKRRRQNRQVSLDQAPAEDMPNLSEMVPDRRPGPEQRMHARQIESRLQEALDGLSDDQKAIVILRDVEGLSYEEIADALDVNIGTVKSRLARGRAGIQAMMKDML